MMLKVSILLEFTLKNMIYIVWCIRFLMSMFNLQ
jgi:hypothetical protein